MVVKAPGRRHQGTRAPLCSSAALQLYDSPWSLYLIPLNVHEGRVLSRVIALVCVRPEVVPLGLSGFWGSSAVR